jgi:peptidoglycan-associated lipoprotein
MKRFALMLAASLMAACSTTTPPAPAPAPAPAPQAAAPVPPPPAPPAKPTPVAQTESPMQLFERARAAMADKSVYFDFDKYAVSAQFDPLISEHAKLVNTYANDYLTLQGNCDERGSREYNLALGQRRADSVRRKLVLLGVPEARIETVSFGKEKPREPCHEERCWAQNRRADFVDAWK